eukprot:127374_1
MNNKNVFMWKQQIPGNIDYSPSFMQSYVQCRNLNSNVSSVEEIKTNIVISDQCETMHLSAQSSCFIPNIELITNDIIGAKCKQYSVTKPAAILRTGVAHSTSSTPHVLPSHDAPIDHCHAIVFDAAYLHDRYTRNVYGFQMQLPSFSGMMCDDMIYSSHLDSVIAYQSFYTKCNKIYSLAKTESHVEWQLLTQVNWRKSASPATMTNLNDRLFISTNSGESVLLNLSDNNWMRLPELKECKQSTFKGQPMLPKQAVFGSNEMYKRVYRLSHNIMYFDLKQGKWIKMPFVNQISRRSHDAIRHQSIWINNESPNVLYTTGETSGSHGVVCAYYDERNHDSRKWNVIPSKRIKEYNRLDKDCTVSIIRS